MVELDPYEVESRKEKPFSTASVDLMRTKDDILPFTTFSARDIELSGAPNLEDFLRSRLSQNFSDTIPEERNGNLGTTTESANQLNLRGWGTATDNEVVVLLNGRRMPAQRTGLNNDSINLAGNFRGIPISSIERVEILPSAGGAIYGERATGGVINIITRQAFSGGRMVVNYEMPWEDHAPKRSAELSYS